MTFGDFIKVMHLPLSCVDILMVWDVKLPVLSYNWMCCLFFQQTSRPGLRRNSLNAILASETSPPLPSFDDLSAEILSVNFLRTFRRQLEVSIVIGLPSLLRLTLPLRYQTF